jgi:hypothetical protein
MTLEQKKLDAGLIGVTIFLGILGILGMFLNATPIIVLAMVVSIVPIVGWIDDAMNSWRMNPPRFLFSSAIANVILLFEALAIGQISSL